MFKSIKRISILARLVVLDGLRRHALIGLILFALTATLSGLVFFDFIPRDISRAVSDFLFSISWFTGFIFLFFHAVQTLAWDNERGALHTFLARPVSRTEYVLALFAGLATLLFTLNIILGGIGWGVLILVKSSVAEAFFQDLSLTFFIISSLGLYLIQLMILSVVTLFSSAVRGSFPVLLLSLCYYFICSGLPVVREAIIQKSSSDVNSSVNAFLKYLTAFFPDFSWLDFKGFVASNDPAPGMMSLTLPFILSFLYIMMSLWFACVIYERRDLQ